MRSICSSAVLVVFVLSAPEAQQPTGRVHRLEATPQTVAYGYYDAAAKPALRIASGDILDVDTLLSMGTDVDLTQATRVAVQEMVDFIAATRGLDKHAAYQLTSIAADVAITQLVDGTMGVHVKLPKAIFTSP
jgi:acetamidase/formamidase